MSERDARTRPIRGGAGGGAAPIDNRTLHLRILREVTPYWRHLAGVFLLSLLAAPLALLTPLPLKIAVDNVIGGHPLPAFLDGLLPESLKAAPESILLLAVLLVVVAAALTQARDLLDSWLTAYTGERLLRAFRARLFAHAQRLSLSYHDARGTADAVYRIQYDATALQRIAVDGVIPFISSALTLVAMVYVTVRINWQLALLALTVTPAVFALSRSYRRRLRRQSREVKEIESAALSIVQEALGAVRVVKAFGRESREEARFAVESDRGLRARIRQQVAEGRFGLLVGLITALGAAAVLYVGVGQVRAGALTLGDLLLVMGYVAQLHSPLRTLGKKSAGMQSYLASAERAFALLHEAPDVPERRDARPIGRARGAVAFERVGFTYDRRRAVLTDVSFAIEPGARLGITGATGAGKTTLINLMLRFYDPTAGAVRLDGIDLRDLRLADLRRQYAVVLQEPVLFSASVAENIAYARPSASRHDIVEAARAANAHDFITALADGYHTLVGERGMHLSGGERQRIALARAFLKDAPVLILDEPTSAVDVATEAAIIEAMERLARGRTTILITHRTSALRPCDVLLTMAQGRLAAFEPAVPMPVRPPVAHARPEEDDLARRRRLHVQP